MAGKRTEGEDGGVDSHLEVGKIRALREGLGLTQEQAGSAAGFENGRQAWNHFESGRQARITLSTLWKLAAVLRVEARDLIKRGPFPTEAPPATKEKGQRKGKP